MDRLLKGITERYCVARRPGLRSGNGLDLNVQARRAKKDVVARLQSYPTRSGRNRDRSASPHDARAMGAAVIKQAEFARTS